LNKNRDASGPQPRRAWLRYSVALGAVAVAFFLRSLLHSRLGPLAPFITFFPAVIFAAWFGGLGPGLLATALSAALTNYFFVAPVRSFKIDISSDAANLGRFIIGSVLVTLLMDALYKARRRAEEQQQLAAVILSSIGDAVLAADADGRVTFINPVAEALTEWAAADAIDQSIDKVFRIFNERTGEAIENPIARVIREGAIVGLENHTILETKSGDRIPIDDSGAPVKDERGRIKGAVLVFRDITEKRRVERERQLAQAELVRSQERLSGILSNMRDGFVALDRDWHYIYVNEEAARQQQRKAADITGKSLWDLSPHLVGTSLEAALRRAMAEQAPAVLEATNPRNGHHFRLRVDPSASGISIYSMDITGEREQAAARTRLSAIVESSQDAIVSKDLNGIVTSWNRGAERIFGYTEAEMLGKPISMLAAPGRADEMPRILERVRRGEPINHYETVRVTKDGRSLDVSLTISPIRDDDGRVIGASKIARDITQQKAHERALRDSEARLNIALEAGGMGAWEWNIEQSKVTWSPQLEAIHGLPAGTFGGTFEDFQRDIHPEDRVRVFETIHAAVESGNDYRVEYRFVRPDGSIGWLEARGRLMSAPRRMVGICQDISDRKETEQALVSQAELLSRSNADLREFAYIASHDLQEPLRNVSTFTQLLERRYKGQLDSDAETFIKYIVDSALRMTQLIRDLLAYSQVIHSDDTASDEVALREPVEWALDNLRSSIEESGAVVEIDPLPKLRCDKSQLAQVFQNLISNAIKYRSAEAPRIHIASERDDTSWIVSVRDNGIGIAPAYHDKVFGVFRRLHGTDYAGTGIGLAICKKIIEKHGGRIWVESEAGQGSAFKFSIPLRGGAGWDK
jgi:PAS domain S-box-containing protein